MNTALPPEVATRSLPDKPSPRRMADAIRILTVDAVERAQSGHPGMPMGMADTAVALFGTALKFDPDDPEWPDRDRFVLSAGHGSMLLYSVLHLTGYAGFERDSLEAFRTYGSRTAGHPEVDRAHGIETTTGPLGQGLATAVGMALAERLLNARFGDDLVDHRTYVIASDGDLMEGVSHEVCSLAGHLRLNRLICLYDDNDVTIDGALDLTCSDDVVQRFQAYGWDVETVDGHDHEAIAGALSRARTNDRPSLIRCRTTIGHGAPTLAGNPSTHSGTLGAEEIARTRQALQWTHPPFEIPSEINAAWRRFADTGKASRAAWQRRLESVSPEKKAAFEDALSGVLPSDLGDLVADFKARASNRDKSEATRFASGHVLARLTPVIHALIGGSADLTPANSTLMDNQGIISRDDFSGRYVHYGIREHSMAAMMNGMALHRGFIPYGGTFLTFTDYARPAIRLAALMGQRVIHVMTHDSIGLGEDGPTHQPIEHLASLRAMPGVLVFRPADAVETGECWELALRNETGPSILALSRQEVPVVRRDHCAENLCARGAYVLCEAETAHRVTLLATGTEVSLAVDARHRLHADGIGTRVVSMPCLELFEAQSNEYKAALLDGPAVKVAIEAAARGNWDRYHGERGAFIGIDRFGASAPAAVLYKAFGITVEAIIAEVKQRL